MSDTIIRYSAYRPKDPSWRSKGVAIVICLHLIILWGIVAGTARNAQVAQRKPLEVVVIQEVIVPPPPLVQPKEIKPPDAPRMKATPPPFVAAPVVAPPEVAPPAIAPTIMAVAASSPTAAVITPPPSAAALPMPAANRTDIEVVCPTQVQPEIPRKALQDRLEGVVEARALIKDGAVREVTILSGPRIFHAAVKAAMMQYKCTVDATEIRATQEFVFNK